MAAQTLAVGDVHGHLDRLEALLRQEGLLNDSGVRLRPEVEVIQLGDLGHYGKETATADELTWSYAPAWLDVILWGNHDRAVINSWHHFSGYQKPKEATCDAIDQAVKNGKLRLAYEAHDFLLTHAGLHAKYKYNNAPQDTAKAAALWLNVCDAEQSQDADFQAIRDAVSTSRGGRATAGGILWRDASESLYKPFRQVFGHSAKDKVRTYQTGKTGNSYCVDVGSQRNGRLAAVWLPEEKFVEINTHENETWEKR